MTNVTKRIVHCPRCRKPAEFSPENPFRPFCSQRCRTIDLGAWADESYKIPTKSDDSRLDSEFQDDPEIPDSDDQS